MTHVIPDLPRQPIPPLADTLDACALSVSPLLNSLQRFKSKLIFKLYGASQAKQQKRLLTLAQQQPINWCAEGVARLWLSCRNGLPFSNNYVLMLEDDPRANTLTGRAARLTLAALNLYQRIRAHGLSPDVMANLPLEMNQYKLCFATHRRPRLNRDDIVSVNGSHHIAVLVDGQVHCLAVDLQRGPVPVSAVEQALNHIIDNSEELNAHDDAVSPSMLSALPRDQWARRRTELLKDDQNAQTLAILEKSLFILCLDTGTAAGSMSGLTANLRDGNSHNRFYDKSMQIVVMENGKAGLCFERGAVDGSVALGFAARLQSESVAFSVHSATNMQRPALIRTRTAAWALNGSLKHHMRAAKHFIAEGRSQRSIETWTTPRLGLRQMKAFEIGPDAVVQLAIQVAAQAVFGAMPTIFEPVQTRHFAGGRMDFIVPITKESIAAVRALQNTDANPYYVAAHMRRAAKAHRHRVLRAKSGRGLAAHLLALHAVQTEDTSSADGEVRSWQGNVLAHLDKGLKALLQQDVLAANGSGFAGIQSFSPIGPRHNMLSMGYIIRENEITFDLRADGRFSIHARAFRTVLDKALLHIEQTLVRSQLAEAM